MEAARGDLTYRSSDDHAGPSILALDARKDFTRWTNYLSPGGCDWQYLLSRKHPQSLHSGSARPTTGPTQNDRGLGQRKHYVKELDTKGLRTKSGRRSEMQRESHPRWTRHTINGALHLSVVLADLRPVTASP